SGARIDETRPHGVCEPLDGRDLAHLSGASPSPGPGPAPSPGPVAPAAEPARRFAPGERGLPTNTWVWIDGDDRRVLAFTYVDADAGLSAKGGAVSAVPSADEVKEAVERPGHTYRLSLGWSDPIVVVTTE